jgi:thymidylate synthase
MPTNEERLLPFYKELYRKVQAQDFVINEKCDNPSGTKIVELIAPRIELDPTQPFLKFSGRKTPENYVAAELEWYNSMDLSVDKIGETAKIWKQIASEEGKVNSNYGWCIYSDENYNQYQHCLEELKNIPDSRRACMIYQRPSMWEDYNYKGMSDFICTWGTHWFIRNGKLLCLVLMRSNDGVYGIGADFAWACHVYMKLYEDLKETYQDLSIGSIIWCPDSFHVYEKHFNMLEKMVTEPLP